MEAKELSRLLEELVREEMEEHPVHATALGLTEHDHRLGEFTADDFDRRAHREVEWLERIDAVSPEGLDLDDAVDRELALAELRGRAVLHGWESWRRNPDVYLGPCLYGVFQLFLRRLRPEAELVEAAVARLRQVGTVLAAARANLAPEMADPLLVRRSLGMCQAGITYAREFLPAEAPDGTMRARLAEAGEEAARELEAFAEHLEDLAERSTGSFALGEGPYGLLLQQREGLGHDASGLRERGWSALEALERDMSVRARELAGTDDFRATITEINADHPSTPEEMREGYAEWTRRARDFLVERELVSFPEGERCEVLPSPHFQRPVLAVASYMRPPAFTDSRVGHFFVPFPPEGASGDDVQQRLAMNSWALIPSISVHEAYPGHHWHLAMAAGTPRSVRKVFGTPYFAEGWGLYTEQMMRRHGFFPDSRMELLQLDMRLFRAARIVVDTGLHAGEMTVDGATTFMQERAGLTEPVAQAEVARYCAWPTQASSYLTGSLEIERMADEHVAGGGDLRTFHDTIAASGVLPLGLAERVVTEASRG